MYQLSFIIVVVVVIKFQHLRSRMLASKVRYILERGSLESRLLAVEVPADDGYPFLSKPTYSSDPFVPSERDQGYFSIHDFYRQRYIYVCAKEIAENASFLSTMEIENVLDLTNEPEEHFSDQTKDTRLRILNGIVHSLKLIMNCPGNIVIHCRHGRTRSPAFIAAYLMIVAGMSQKGVYCYLSSEYTRQRSINPDSTIDRLNRYIGTLQDLMELVK